MRRESHRSVFVKQYLYIVVLGLSLALALLGQFALNDKARQSANDAHVFYLVSEQRLLSQTVSRSALVIEATILHTDQGTRQHYKELLSTTLARWQQLHDSSVVAKTDGETISLYSTLEPHYHSLLNASYSLLASINTPLQTSHAMIVTPVHSIFHEEPTYLHIINMLIMRYQRNLNKHALYLKCMDIIAITGIAIVIVESVFLLGSLGLCFRDIPRLA